MKKFTSNLLFRICLAIVLGISLGACIAPSSMGAPHAIVRLFNTFGALFDQLIKFIVPLIILGFVTPAIAETGRSAGRLLLATVALAYASTLFSGLLGYAVATATFPHCVDASLAAAGSAAARAFPPYFTIALPPVIDVMSALALAFMVGLGIVATSAEGLRRAAAEFRQLVEKAVSGVLVPLLPLYIFTIFLDMTAVGKAALVIRSFGAVIAITFALSLVLLLLQFLVAGVIARTNPFARLWTMFPAYMTAMGTSSSAATIPVTLRQTLANGVRPETANFVIPLCATVHLAGSMLKLICFTVAIQLLTGRSVAFAPCCGFIALAGVTMVAAPGVPGGAIMAAIGLVTSFFGLTPADQGLIIALYVATDGFGTACNITGDGAIALVVDRLAARQTS